MQTTLRILHLEDDPIDSELIYSILTQEKLVCALERVDNKADFIHAIEGNNYDIILADYSLPSFDGMAALEIAKKMCPEIPFIFISGKLGEDLAIESLKNGATDYVLKHNLSRLVPSIQRSLREVKERTKRKKMELALRESEERYRSLFYNTLSIMLLINANSGKIVDANYSAYQYYGYERNTFIGKKISDLSKMDNNEINKILKLAAKAKKNYITDQHFLANGEVRDIEIYISPIKSEGKTLLFSIIHDITDRKKAESELSRLASVVEQSSELIIITDLRGNIEYINPAFEKITGYAFREIGGKNVNIIKSGKHDKEFYHSLWETITSGKTWTGVFNNKRKNGEYYVENAVIFPIKDSMGKTLNYAAVKRDITSERILEEQLNQSRKLEGIGQLAGGIAHDFNNIMTAISGYAELAIMGLKNDGVAESDLIAIMNASKRASNLTRQLLAFSRKQMIKPRVIDINVLINDLQELFHRFINEDIKFHFKLSPKINSIKADPGQIEQVFVNLVVNARDAINQCSHRKKKQSIFIETKNVHVDVRFVQSHPDIVIGDYVKFSVSDSGVGMDEETRKKIFEPFFTTKKSDQGTGLGLSTVYGIVKQNNAYIYVHSKVSKGSSFNIYWPVVQEKVTPEKIRGISEEVKGGSETILFVEDDIAVLNFASKALKFLGYNVIEAKSGIEALEIQKKLNVKIDLLVSDIIMPEMGGRELVEHLSIIFPDLKILYTSGYTEKAIVKSGVLEENINFINKPYSIDALAKKIRAVLEREVVFAK